MSSQKKIQRTLTRNGNFFHKNTNFRAIFKVFIFFEIEKIFFFKNQKKYFEIFIKYRFCAIFVEKY